MKTTAMVILLILAGFIGVSWMRFQIVNPKCNEMGFYRHFVEVVTWTEPMEVYQLGGNQ